MELASWLKGEKIDTFPILGFDSFKTFIKICETISKWAIDDSGLANRADSYKIWVCWCKDTSLEELKSEASKYSTMGLLLHYININIVENNQIGLYTKLDWLNDHWQMSYGITNNKKLYKIGEFEYSISTKLPESEIVKYINDELEDFNSRDHYLLRTIKKVFYKFDPGYCQRIDPVIVKNTCTLSCINLGSWMDGKPNAGEPEKWLEIFKTWVATMPWWDLVKLTVKIKKGNWIDFVITIK